jgi:putative transcriptional regulator
MINSIKTIRKKLKLSQGELAAKLGRSQSCISHYERGERDVDVCTAKAIVSLARKHGHPCSLDSIFNNTV